MRGLFPALLFSLLLTLAAESTVALLFGIRGKKDLLLVVLVNLLTNPPVVLLYWLAASYITSATGLLFIQLGLEISALFVEYFCYKKYGGNIPKPFLLALAANGTSYMIGLLINFLL